VCFLVNTQKIKKEAIKVTFKGLIVCTLHVKVYINKVKKEISIYNVYNLCS